MKDQSSLEYYYYSTSLVCHVQALPANGDASFLYDPFGLVGHDNR